MFNRKNIGQTLSVTQSAGLNLSKEDFDIELRANITYSSVNYSINKSLNENYITQSYSGELAYTYH